MQNASNLQEEWMNESCIINITWSHICDNERNVKSMDHRRQHQLIDHTCTRATDAQAINSSKSGKLERCSFT